MDWYKRWFQEHYFLLYPHRTREQAKQEITFLLSRLTPKRALDIGCGDARHLQALLERNVNALGIDYSPFALKLGHAALARENLPQLLTRADMRALPFRDKTFDTVLSLFNSFGYFASDEDHLGLLTEWARVLASQGALVLDYMNHDYLIDNLQSESLDHDWRYRIYQKRRFAAGRIIKDIEITDTVSGEVYHYQESVRLYRFPELQQLLRKSGFRINSTFGNFQGEPFHPTSKQLILFAEKTTS